MHKGSGEYFYVLPADRAWAQKRVADIEQQIADLGPEFYEVFNQSSETWHDNAPFDALRDKQSLLAAERYNLKEILNKSSLKPPKMQRGAVGIGSWVTISRKDQDQDIFIAGHWSHMTGEKVNGALVITCGSPLGQALVGAAKGQKLVIGGSDPVLVKSIT